MVNKCGPGGGGLGPSLASDENAPASSLLDIRFDGNAPEEPGTEVAVVFVDEKERPIRDDALPLRLINMPTNGKRMPTKDIGHDIFFDIGGMATLFMSVGTEKKMTRAGVRSLGGRIVRALQHEKFISACVHAGAVFKVSCEGKEETLRALLHGLQTPTYALSDFKTEKKERALKVVRIPKPRVSSTKANKIRDLVNDIVIAEQKSRRWIDLPAQAGAMSGADLRLAATKIREAHDSKIAFEYIVGNALAAKGLNAIWNVGKGRTDDPPSLVVLHYKGAGEGKPTIALVGKGIVFDTGGEQTKDSESIVGMHADMAGAAMALATLDLAARRGAKVNLVATLAIADNSVSGSSYHPQSVIKTHSGKTVEVLNTDAEGRLVLADAVSYTEKHYKPDYLVTLATLTGACVIALGTGLAGLFPKTEKMAEAMKEASSRTWNEIWRMPLFEAKHATLKKSAIADVTNLGPRPGGAITGAKFIMEEFTETEHAAHLDVAGVAASYPIGDGAVDATGEKCKFSTGWGPALLWELIGLLTNGWDK